MFAFFNSIVTMLGFVVDLVVSFLQAVCFIFTQIPVALAYIVGLTAYLPSYLSSFVLLFAGTCIVFNILNKGE